MDFEQSLARRLQRVPEKNTFAVLFKQSSKLIIMDHSGPQLIHPQYIHTYPTPGLSNCIKTKDLKYAYKQISYSPQSPTTTT